LPWQLRFGLRRRVANRKRAKTVDEWPILESAGGTPAGWPGWPGDSQFAFVLTHDVESQAGLDQVQKLAELEMSFGFRSSFNFIPEGGYEIPEALIQWLTDRGFEVGVHDLRHDGHLYSSREEFRMRARRINHYLAKWNATGFRSGFMLHNYEWLHDLNVAYDASSFDTDPFEPQSDGVGTIFPFWVPKNPNLNPTSSPISHLPSSAYPDGYFELPYTLPQDSTLFILFGEKSPEIWCQKLDWIAKHGGMALLNVHPDYVDFSNERSDPHRFPVRYYAEFLEHVRDRFTGTYWHALPREVAEFCQKSRKELGGEPPVTKGKEPQSELSATRIADFPALHSKRAAVVVFSNFPFDPRPRRAAEALRDAGMTVDIICLKENDKDLSFEELDGITVRRLPITRQRGGKIVYLWQYASFILSSTALLLWRSLHQRYDLVHVHNMPDVLVVSAVIPKILGAKVLLDLHDPMPELMMTIFGADDNARSVTVMKRLERWSMALADRVLTVNRACRKIFGSRSCPLDKVHVVMNSPDERFFGAEVETSSGQSDGASEKPFIIMCHGSIVDRHGIDLGVEALYQIRESVPNAELRIYGHKTDFVDTVMARAKELGVEDRVQYMGGANIEQIVEAIDEADLGIIPNRRSIFTELNTPTRIFEYLSRGVPVIAPRASGILDYFSEEEMIYFELGDADDLARKMEWAYSHPDAVREVLRQGQKIYNNHHWTAERHRMLGMVEGLLATPA